MADTPYADAFLEGPYKEMQEAQDLHLIPRTPLTFGPGCPSPLEAAATLCNQPAFANAELQKVADADQFHYGNTLELPALDAFVARYMDGLTDQEKVAARSQASRMKDKTRKRDGRKRLKRKRAELDELYEKTLAKNRRLKAENEALKEQIALLRSQSTQ